MTKIFITFLLIVATVFSIAALSLTTMPTHAQDLKSLTESFEQVKTQAGQLGLSTESEPKKLITKVITTFLQIIGVIALALVIWGGFVYLTSAGNENRATKGKQIILGTIIGLIIIGLSAVIVNFVIGLFAGDGG